MSYLLAFLRALPALVAVFATPLSAVIASSEIATVVVGSLAAALALLLRSPLTPKLPPGPQP
jgi:hypothetical protein